MKTLKDEFKEVLEAEPELTILHWAYGTSLHAWVLMGVQLRLYMSRIRSNKGLSNIPIFTKEKWGTKWLDGRPLAKAFMESCEATPSYACIPQYGDFKQSLEKSLDARDALIHGLGMSTTMHIQEFASTDSEESWKKRFKHTEVQIIRSYHRDISLSTQLFSDMASHLEARLEVHR